MPGGRPPLPHEVKKLRGTLRKSRINPYEVELNRRLRREIEPSEPRCAWCWTTDFPLITDERERVCICPTCIRNAFAIVQNGTENDPETGENGAIRPT